MLAAGFQNARPPARGQAPGGKAPPIVHRNVPVPTKSGDVDGKPNEDRPFFGSCTQYFRAWKIFLI